MKKNTFLFAGKENRRIFTPVITTKANKMTTTNLNNANLNLWKNQALTAMKKKNRAIVNGDFDKFEYWEKIEDEAYAKLRELTK